MRITRCFIRTTQNEFIDLSEISGLLYFNWLLLYITFLISFSYMYIQYIKKINHQQKSSIKMEIINH